MASPRNNLASRARHFQLHVWPTSLGAPLERLASDQRSRSFWDWYNRCFNCGAQGHSMRRCSSGSLNRSGASNLRLAHISGGKLRPDWQMERYLPHADSPTISRPEERQPLHPRLTLSGRRPIVSQVERFFPPAGRPSGPPLPARTQPILTSSRSYPCCTLPPPVRPSCVLTPLMSQVMFRLKPLGTFLQAPTPPGPRLQFLTAS